MEYLVAHEYYKDAVYDVAYDVKHDIDFPDSDDWEIYEEYLSGYAKENARNALHIGFEKWKKQTGQFYTRF